MALAIESPDQDNRLREELADLGASLQRSTVQVQSEGRGHGSGVIWSAGGDIITNAHVAHESENTVVLWDGRELRAELRGRDRERDLAHLTVAGTDLPAAAVGDSDALSVGQIVLAVGNPLGFTGALTLGIIHAIAPAPDWGRGTWVQADVRLLPGNSGGPLADAFGRVIGINSMVAGGLGLAVPSNAVEQFLRSTGARPHIGISVQPVLVPIAGTRTSGLLVLDVTAGSAADAAGMLVGDIVLAVDGQRIEGSRALSSALYGPNAPATVRFDLWRGGTKLTLAVPLRPRRISQPEDQGAAA
jgi:serine protease Do